MGYYGEIYRGPKGGWEDLKFLIVIVVLIIFGLLLEKLLNKLLGIERKKISDTSGKRVDRWGRGIVVVIFLSTYWFIIDEDSNFIKAFWMLYFIFILGYQSIMELIYLKNSKQYISTLIMLFLGLIAMYNIEFFIQLFG